MWNRIKPYLKFYSFAWYEFKQSRGYGLVKAISLLYKIIAGIIFGAGLYQIVKFLYPVLSIHSWVTLMFAVALVFLLLVVEFLRRFHDRTVNEMNAEYKSHAWKIHKLSVVAGYAEQIDHLHLERKEVPRKMYEDLGLHLQIALQECYGKDGITIFNYGNSDKIVIPDDPYIWFSISHSRLSQLITEQIQAQSNSHRSTNLTK